MIHVQPPTQPVCPDPAASDVLAARAERRGLVLERAARMCLELAEAVHQRALEQVAAGEDVGQAVMAHGRAMRALRQTVALGERLDQPRRVREAKAEAERAARDKAADDVRKNAEAGGFIAKHTVYAAVTDLILAKAPQAGPGRREAEQLVDSLCEQLDDAPSEDFADGPISELVTRVCEMIGIIPDWSFWEETNWAVREARAETRGSPYVEGWEAEVEPDEVGPPAEAALPP